MINTNFETLQNSSLAYSLKNILNTVDANKWEDIIGKIVRLDLSNEGQIQAISHPIESLKLPLIPEALTENSNKNEENEIVEVEEVKE